MMMLLAIRPELLTAIFALRSVPCTEEFDWHTRTFLAKEQHTHEFNRGNGGAYV